MRKKLLVTLLCMLTSLGVLSGCGSAKGTDNIQEDNVVSDNQGVSSGGEVSVDEEVVAEEADKLYTVTANGIVNDELSDFFLLWFGCKLDGEPEIKNLSSMFEHSGIIGMLTINKDLHTVHNYDDTYFTGLDIYFHLPERPSSYYVKVSNLLSNFDAFRYYEGTDAVLSMVVEVACYINDDVRVTNSGHNNQRFAVTLVNDTSNPEEWLISGVYSLNQIWNDELTVESMQHGNVRIWEDYQFDKAEKNGFDIETELVNEDLESVNNSDLPEYMKAYANTIEMDIFTNLQMIKLGNSDVPYLFKSGNSRLIIYHYEDGEVVEKEYMSWHHYEDAILLEDKIAIRDFVQNIDGVPWYDYYLCDFSNGVIASDEEGFFEGTEIDEATYESYKNKGVVLDVGHSYDTIEEAYNNMIIWE